MHELLSQLAESLNPSQLHIFSLSISFGYTIAPPLSNMPSSWAIILTYLNRKEKEELEKFTAVGCFFKLLSLFTLKKIS